jgi:hypothetical protein
MTGSPSRQRLTGSSAPSARAGGAPRCGRRWRAVLAHPTPSTVRAWQGARLRSGDERPSDRFSAGYRLRRDSPPSRRNDRRGFARRRPAARALRVARRWPPATLAPGHRRARGLTIGSVALLWPGTHVGTNAPSNGPNNHNQPRPRSLVEQGESPSATSSTTTPRVLGFESHGPTNRL